MIRISIPWLIQILGNIDDLDGIQTGKTVLDELAPLVRAQSAVELVFSSQSVYGPYLRASRDAAARLHAELDALKDGNWGEKTLDEFQVQTLKSQKQQFKTVFLADLGAIPSYLVTRKANYDIIFLIEDGMGLFPSTLKSKAPETEDDAKEVGRALAFELATACGFHTFRVTESVVRRYWDQVAKKPRPNLETLGTFAAELEKAKLGDTKVVEAIKQMTKLHRNPLIHPEVILTVEEAIAIIGMANSVIIPMLQALPDSPPTTGAPSSTASAA